MGFEQGGRSVFFIDPSRNIESNTGHCRLSLYDTYDTLSLLDPGSIIVVLLIVVIQQRNDMNVSLISKMSTKLIIAIMLITHEPIFAFVHSFSDLNQRWCQDLREYTSRPKQPLFSRSAVSSLLTTHVRSNGILVGGSK
jgi:hypothetical protein